jgi:hypothetical protein
MTDHVLRLYAGALGLVAFFLVWAAVAAQPWAATGDSDPRVTALERREERLARETRQVNRRVERRFTVYRRRLARRKRAIARRERDNAATLAAAPSATASAAGAPAAPSAPAVSVTAAPPVTTTSSS